MNRSAFGGMRSATHGSGMSSLHGSTASHTGLNNSAFASARMGSNSAFGRNSTGSTFGHPFGGRGFGRGFDHDRGFRFHDRFGFGCFGCGFGFGFGPGFGFGWGWGGWWGPWWGSSLWWAPPVWYPQTYVYPQQQPWPPEYYGSPSGDDVDYSTPSGGTSYSDPNQIYNGTRMSEPTVDGSKDLNGTTADTTVRGSTAAGTEAAGPDATHKDEGATPVMSPTPAPSPAPAPKPEVEKVSQSTS